MTTSAPDGATSTRTRPAPAADRRPDVTDDEHRRREVLARARQLRARRSTTARTSPAPAAATSAARTTLPTTVTPSRQAGASERTGRHERGALQRWRERSYGHGEAPLRALLAAASEAAALTMAITSPRTTPKSVAKPELPTGQPHEQGTTRGRKAAAKPSPRWDEEETDVVPCTPGHSRAPVDRQRQL